VEQKFYVPPQTVFLALALLRRTCRPDPDYPGDQVNSLYFDTSDLDEHQKSDNGDFAKDKVRIRWYGLKHDPHLTSCSPHSLEQEEGHSAAELEEEMPVWLELKSRRGFASTKQRLRLTVPAEALAYRTLPKGIVSPQTLSGTIAGFGFFPRRPLVPVVAISYERRRFVEPSTGFRVSIDSHIRSSTVMCGLGIGERGLELPGAVVEVKGSIFEVPLPLRPLREIGSSWTRYSKYSSSLDAHASARGGVSRLWPSGMMEREPGALAAVRVPADSSPVVWSPGPVRLVRDYEME
jgi:hypothetical protein